jgi:hypothetical protein
MGVGCSTTCILCVEFRRLTGAQIPSLHWLLRSSCLQSPHLGCCGVKHKYMWTVFAWQFDSRLLAARCSSPYKTCECSSNMRASCRSFAEEESGGNSDHHGGHPHGTADACTEGTGMSHILLEPANGKLKQPFANPPSHDTPIYLRSMPELTGCHDINATIFMRYRRSPWSVNGKDVEAVQ